MRTLACFRDFNSFIFIIIDCVLKIPSIRCPSAFLWPFTKFQHIPIQFGILVIFSLFFLFRL
ncbi:hypothetical protein RhiirA1_74901 [Rhizophagus irregularis]|uniref:Uncharacterized protein n=1 Tax=Rhizophagus irregularis TaxID=588596 RepID=A0A2N0S6V5_9GLOM|nr:hypothetical protein RhiirA1_74901 [Rhizophagus irregularis]